MGAAPANTYTQPGASGSVREDLANIIWRIDPDETPFVSSLQRVGAKQINTEWLLQTLNTAQDVPQPEGFTAVISPAVKPARLGNICQIFARTVAVSGTLRNVDIPGGEDEYNRQLVLRGLELKRDLELVATGNVVKTITDPRHMGGLQTWSATSNTVTGAGGTAGTADGTTAIVPGTAYDLTLANVNTVTQAIWTAGAKATLAIMSGNIKNYFSSLSQGGTNNAIVAQNIVMASPEGEMTIQGSVDVYRTNFGTLQLAPDRFMPAHVIEVITPDYVELAPLPNRDMVQQAYATIGDLTQGGVVFEGTLRVMAPLAHGFVVGLNQ
jgi:hypothetical protein